MRQLRIFSSCIVAQTGILERTTASAMQFCRFPSPDLAMAAARSYMLEVVLVILKLAVAMSIAFDICIPGR
jgi:hypothetical protein